MNNRTEGAWILHHANKLREIDSHDFEDIDLAGKTGKLLSGLVASHEVSKLDNEKVNAIAKVAGVNKAEISTLLDHLEAEHLIDRGASGLAVLGVTTASVLGHTSNVFNRLAPSSAQRAAIALAEEISAKPILEKDIKEKISDLYKLSNKETSQIVLQSEEIGFIDSEVVDGDKMLFNGNLFKNETIQKTQKVLDSLTPDERNALLRIDNELKQHGVITFDNAEKLAGKNLLEKVHSIGMYEFSKVSNTKETKLFITKPEAFSKFGNPFEDDALDLAKAFVASLSYGINYSSNTRGRIEAVGALLRKLIAGETVGPAPAIGQDYQYLEFKRVLQIINKGNGYFSMRLLKRDVGELALQVLKQGDIAENALLTTSNNVNAFVGPEATRSATRKRRKIKSADIDVAKLLRTFRM